MPFKKVPIRLMAPFSMQCTHCHEYIYKSTKFNARKTITGDSYLGIPIVQLSFRCSSCSSEIIIRTDPKSSNYVISKGATRTLSQQLDQAGIIEEQPFIKETSETESHDSKTASHATTSADTTAATTKSGSATISPAVSSPHASTVHKRNALNLKADEALQRHTSASVTKKNKKLPVPKRRKHLAE